MMENKLENPESLSRVKDTTGSTEGVKGEQTDIPVLSESEIQQADQFDFLRFTFVDIQGIPRSKCIARPNIQQFLKTGAAFCSVTTGMGPRGELINYPELASLGFPNCPAMPMPGTLHKLPWATEGRHTVGEVLCETFWAEPHQNAGQPQEVCPRYIARRQLKRLEDLGYELYSGFEAEFGVYDVDTGMPVFRGNDIFSSLVTCQFESFMYDVDQKLRESGVDCGPMNTEYGHGQFEIAMMPTRGIRTADALLWLKEGIKEMGLQKKMTVSFMTKPFPDASTNGLHFSHSLWTVGTNLNVFQAPPETSAGRAELSDIGRRWIGGLIKHSKALTALCSPTVNCYRRLHTPWAPDRANWGLENRETAFRFKLGDSPYVENRIPSGPANPYLILAATVAAGMDGIRSGIDPTPEPNDPCAELLPNSLEEALKDLEDDLVMVEALGKEFVEWFVKIKRDAELAALKDFDKNKSDTYEKERYLYFRLL